MKNSLKTAGNKTTQWLARAINFLTVWAIKLSLVVSAMYGISTFINAHPYIKYSLAVLVVLFAVEYIHRNSSKKQHKTTK